MASRQQRNRRHSQIKSPSEEWPEKMKLSQAHKFLGISFATMSNLVSRGVVAVENDPLDRRVRLVKRADLEAILRMRTSSE
jgi:hypothetical protein